MNIQSKLKELFWEDVIDWVGERTARRAEAYDTRVGEIVSLGDCLAARVRGITEYRTNVFLDSCNEYVSVCTCPVGLNCKHGAALALVASEKLKKGDEIKFDPNADLKLDRDAIKNRVNASRLSVRRIEQKPVPESEEACAKRESWEAYSRTLCRSPEEIRERIGGFAFMNLKIKSVKLFGYVRLLGPNEMDVIEEALKTWSNDEFATRKIVLHLHGLRQSSVGLQGDCDGGVLLEFEDGRMLRIDADGNSNFEILDKYHGRHKEFCDKLERCVGIKADRVFASVIGKTIVGYDVESSDCQPELYAPHPDGRQYSQFAHGVSFRLDDGATLSLSDGWEWTDFQVKDSGGQNVRVSAEDLAAAFVEFPGSRIEFPGEREPTEDEWTDLIRKENEVAARAKEREVFKHELWLLEKVRDLGGEEHTVKWSRFLSVSRHRLYGNKEPWEKELAYHRYPHFQLRDNKRRLLWIIANLKVDIAEAPEALVSHEPADNKRIYVSDVEDGVSYSALVYSQKHRRYFIVDDAIDYYRRLDAVMENLNEDGPGYWLVGFYQEGQAIRDVLARKNLDVLMAYLDKGRKGPMIPDWLWDPTSDEALNWKPPKEDWPQGRY